MWWVFDGLFFLFVYIVLFNLYRPKSEITLSHHFHCEMILFWSRHMIYLLIASNLSSAEPISLQDSLSLISSQNLEVQIARLQADQVNFERLTVLTNILNVQATGSWLDFGEPLDTYIIGDENTDVDCTSFESFGFGDLCDSFSEPLRVRDERIFDGSLQIALPISALYSIVQGYSANQHLREIKSLEVEQTKQRIELSVVDIYLQTLDLQSQRQILEDTLTRLRKHQRSVQAFVDQGLAHPVQAKELHHAIQQTSLGLRQLDQGYQLLCQQMSLLLGLNDLFSPLPLQDNIDAPKEEHINSNLSHRIATHQYQAAQDGAQSAMGDLIPTVALMAATTSTKGQGPFTPTSQQYLGLNVQGEFGLGNKWMTFKQRQMDVTMAQQGLKIQQQALPIQQQQLKQHWQHSIEKILLAESKVEIENIKRSQAQAQFDGHQITVTDLLDAESGFSDAQIALLRTQHQSILAQAKYQQSINADTLYFQSN